MSICPLAKQHHVDSRSRVQQKTCCSADDNRAHLVRVLVQLEGGCNLDIQLHSQLLVLLVAVELVHLDVRLLFLKLHQQRQHHFAWTTPEHKTLAVVQTATKRCV